MDPTESMLGNLAGGVIATALDSHALIQVTGDDAHAFLQGQFSNDLNDLNETGDAANPVQCQLNAYCNPKGRVLAVMRLVRYDGGWGMIVPAGLADQLVSRLKMFVLRARVEIAPRPQTALLGLINGAQCAGGRGLERVPVGGVVPRHMMIGEPQAVDSFMRANALEAAPGDGPWRLADILSGIPQVYAQTAVQFIPQMINLDRVGGLSFTKGCYPGQEIVARLRYRGRVKQRMSAGVARGLAALAPGDPVHSDQHAGQKVGLVVDAVPTDRSRGEYAFSATAPVQLSDGETLRVGPVPGAAWTRIALPYEAAEAGEAGQE